MTILSEGAGNGIVLPLSALSHAKREVAFTLMTFLFAGLPNGPL